MSLSSGRAIAWRKPVALSRTRKVVMPDNAGYYHAAYASAALIYALYMVSIWWRARRVRERLTRSPASHD